MHRLLLGFAALTAATLPGAIAHAQAFEGSSNVRSHEFRGSSFHNNVPEGFCRDSRGSRHGDRRGRNVCRSDVVMDWYGGEWAQYNNRGWEPDSYNDWWHDRPDRAYPAWMRRNEDCQRQWFSGDVLKC